MNTKLKNYKVENDILDISFDSIAEKNKKFLLLIKQLMQDILEHLNEFSDLKNDKVLLNLRKNNITLINSILNNEELYDKIISVISNDTAIESNDKDNIIKIIDKLLDSSEIHEKIIENSIFKDTFLNIQPKITTINDIGVSSLNLIKKSNSIITTLNSKINVLNKQSFSTSKVAILSGKNLFSSITKAPIKIIKGVGKSLKRISSIAIAGISKIKNGLLSLGKKIFNIGKFIVTAIIKAVSFVVSLVISLVSGALGVVFKIILSALTFAFKVITFALKIVFGAIKIISFIAVKLVSSIANIAKKTVLTVTKITKKIFNKIFSLGSGTLKTIFKILIFTKAFWFFLGFFYGKIKKEIDILKEKFSPYINSYEEIKEKIKEEFTIESIKNRFNQGISFLSEKTSFALDFAVDKIKDISTTAIDYLLETFDRLVAFKAVFLGNLAVAGAAAAGGLVGSLIGYALGGSPIGAAIGGVLGGILVGSLASGLAAVWEKERAELIAPVKDNAHILAAASGISFSSVSRDVGFLAEKPGSINGMVSSSLISRAGPKTDIWGKPQTTSPDDSMIAHYLENIDIDNYESPVAQMFRNDDSDRSFASTANSSDTAYNSFITSMTKEDQSIAFDIIDNNGEKETFSKEFKTMWDLGSGQDGFLKTFKEIKRDKRNLAGSEGHAEFNKYILGVLCDLFKIDGFKESLLNDYDILAKGNSMPTDEFAHSVYLLAFLYSLNRKVVSQLSLVLNSDPKLSKLLNENDFLGSLMSSIVSKLGRDLYKNPYRGDLLDLIKNAIALDDIAAVDGMESGQVATALQVLKGKVESVSTIKGLFDYLNLIFKDNPLFSKDLQFLDLVINSNVLFKKHGILSQSELIYQLINSYFDTYKLKDFSLNDTKLGSIYSDALYDAYLRDYIIGSGNRFIFGEDDNLTPIVTDNTLRFFKNLGNEDNSYISSFIKWRNVVPELISILQQWYDLNQIMDAMLYGGKANVDDAFYHFNIPEEIKNMYKSRVFEESFHDFSLFDTVTQDDRALATILQSELTHILEDSTVNDYESSELQRIVKEIPNDRLRRIIEYILKEERDKTGGLESNTATVIINAFKNAGMSQENITDLSNGDAEYVEFLKSISDSQGESSSPGVHSDHSEN